MIDSVVHQFEAFNANGGPTPSWLRPLRQKGYDRFRKVGLPSSKDEEWRFTPLGPIARTDFRTTPVVQASLVMDDIAPFLFGHLEWPRLVFVDGRFVPGLSSVPDTPGVRVRPLSQALETAPQILERNLGRLAGVEETPFTALSTAFIREGAVVEVSPGTVVPEPIHLVFVTTPASAGLLMSPRHLVVIGDNARAQLVESYVTVAPATSYLTNVVMEVDVGANAWVEHARIQRESEAAFHVAFSTVDQQRDSHYRSFTLTMGGAIARHNLHARLSASNVESLLYGLYIGHEHQLIDTHTAIFHDQPNCRSWEVYKGLLDGHARGVFNGKIFVKPEAQKTDAKQTNRTLLLSDTASIDTKPQLEIFADDVKCTHGAAVGQLEEQALFYLQSRGIPKDIARRLLTYAFAAEVLNEIASTPIRDALERIVRERLAA